LSNYNSITEVELIRFYWEKIKNNTLKSEASYKRLHFLMQRVKDRSIKIPKIVKLIELEIKWQKK
tara:strand:- start:1041 stop:1235 length:195 start_codon:yes stop_codon:yes gene_type:complete